MTRPKVQVRRWREEDLAAIVACQRAAYPDYPEAECFDEPVNKWSFDFAVKADSIDKVPVTWKLPDEEGCYWLTARMTGVAGRPVLSQRFVRAIAPSIVPTGRALYNVK